MPSAYLPTMVPTRIGTVSHHYSEQADANVYHESRTADNTTVQRGLNRCTYEWAIF